MWWSDECRVERRPPLNSQNEWLYREVEFNTDVSKDGLLVVRDTQQPGVMAAVSQYGKSFLQLRDKVFPEIQAVMGRFKKPEEWC